MAQYGAMITEAEDRVLTVVKQAQDVALATISTVTDRVGSFIPELPAIPFADKLPTPAEVVETTYALTERLLEAQRAYALDLLEALSPIISKIEIGSTAPTANVQATPITVAAPKTATRKRTSRSGPARRPAPRKATPKA